MSGTSELDLQTAIVNFVAWLRQTFPDEHAQDQGAFERRAAKIFKKRWSPTVKADRKGNRDARC